ncbi:MAG: hypothetical protein AB7I32_10935 [Gammaproteobacteria bacterium]
MRNRAQWFDPIRPVEQPAEPDPCARVELVLQAIELLRRFDLTHALVVADGLARWLEGGDLARELGLRVKRGQRAPLTTLKRRARDDLVRALAESAEPAALAREIQAGDTERGRRLRELGAPDSPRHLARIIRGTARRRDMSS